MHPYFAVTLALLISGSYLCQSTARVSDKLRKLKGKS